MKDKSLFNLAAQDALIDLAEQALGDDNAPGTKEAQETLTEFGIEQDQWRSIVEGNLTREAQSVSRQYLGAVEAVDRFNRDLMDPTVSSLTVFGGSYSSAVPSDLRGTAAGKALGDMVSRSVFGRTDSDETNFVTRLRGNISPFVDISSDRLLHTSSATFKRITDDLNLISNERTMVAEHLSQASIFNGNGVLLRPGILPAVQMINEAESEINIDLFQLQNPAVVEMLLAKGMRADQEGKSLKITVRTANAGIAGKFDETGVAILGPNQVAMNALRRLQDVVGLSSSLQIEVMDARAVNHQKLMVTDKTATIGSMNLTRPVIKPSIKRS